MLGPLFVSSIGDGAGEMSDLSTALRGIRRYLDIHTKCRFTGIPLKDGNRVVGHVDEWVFTHELIRLRGWTLAHRLKLEIGGEQYALPRRIQRGDVAASLGARMLATGNQHGRVGFEVTLPRRGGPARLIAEDMPDAGPWPLPVPDGARMRRRRRLAGVRLVRDGVVAVPAALRYLLNGRRREDRERLRERLGFAEQMAPGLTLDPSFLAPSAVPAAAAPAVTIILPVYNAFDLLCLALDRVDRFTDVPWHIVIIEDASPDERVRPWLEAWCAARAGRVTLLLNETNRGFIGSVNRGLEAAARRGGPVILLNSDALVPEGWASRLLAPIMDDDRVASVTPMSNDATILTVPWIGGRVTLPPDAADAIDVAARSLSLDARAEMPTGVGFCMAMSRSALTLEPALDPAFGRGYGEEVDWCRKVAAQGMVHVGIGNLFVEHRGGQSFGSAAKTEALERSAAIISARYPEFDEAVRRFIIDDPLITARLALALAWAAERDSDPVQVLIGHSLGGGAEHWLAARIAERCAEGRPSVVLRVGGMRRFAVELHADDAILVGETNSLEVVRLLVGKMPRRQVVYSCGVGDARPWELPQLLCDLSADPGASLEVLFHDYFPVSPSLNLLNADDSYTGVPSISSNDPAHRLEADGVMIPLGAWRTAWGAALHQAERIIVFSNSSREIVTEAWPEVADKIVCQPHAALFQAPRLDQPRGTEPGVIGVLGAIGAVKGAQFLTDLARYLDRTRDAPRLVIIGEFDHSFPLPASVTVTGRYDPSSLPRLLAAHGITAWLMPSIWPETFSFTTREMLATGLPVMAFDLGAQGEAVREAENGYLVPPDPAAILDCYRKLK